MLTKNQIEALQQLFPEKITTHEDVLKKHSGNVFYISQYMPDAVVLAESEDDVMGIVNFCINHKIPLIPYGSGTSVEGHTAAVKGGICLNMSKMEKVIHFNPEDHYVIVQAGIAYNKLNDYLGQYGYHFPVEAGWGASIGGMVSTNASGAGAVDSGSMMKNVMGCRVIVYKEQKALMINTGTKAIKSSAGYPLTQIFVGAEGTLGVITEVVLRIRKNFFSSKTLCCQFDEIHDAVSFVINLKGLVQFRRAELLDKLQTSACVAYSNITFLHPDKVTILMELGGNELTVNEEAKLILEQAHHYGIENIKIVNDKQSAEPIWMMRKNACFAAIQLIDPSKKAMATDASVPISKLAECIKACYQHMQRMGIKAPLISHVGDGNFHFTLLVDPLNAQDLDQALTFNKCVIDEALKVGGTCTGEHGIGLGKINYLKSQHGDSLFLMERIKESFDPLGIFNPGKIVTLTHSVKP